jgi:hypothetical protein
MHSEESPPDSERDRESAVGPWRGRRALIVVVLVVSAVLLTAGIYYELDRSLASPSQVTVQGTVTVSPWYTPLSLTFAALSGGYMSRVSNGTYSLKLPNHQVYNVTLFVANNQTHKGGTCYLGQLALESRNEAFVYNIVGC